MTEYEEQVIGELLTGGGKLDVLISRSEEMLEVLGNIYGLLIFFAVVLLCYFVYKFFRMFF